MLTKSARLVLLALQTSADHSYTALQTSAGIARATLASALQELTAAGLITAVKAFGKSTRYTISQAAGSLTAHSSSSSVVQKFNSSIVQPIALHDDESLSKENISSSCNAKTSELLNQRPDFRAQVFALLGEWKLAGRKREQLADAIANLPGAPESILSDIQTIRAGAVKRATTNPAGLTVHILTEYAQTRQIALFDLPTSAAPRKQGRGVQRRPQVQYTDEQREAAEERARVQIAERAARRAALESQSEAAHV